MWLKSIFNLIPIHYFQNRERKNKVQHSIRTGELERNRLHHLNVLQVRVWKKAKHLSALSRLSAIIKAVKNFYLRTINSIPLALAAANEKSFSCFHVMTVQLSSLVQLAFCRGDVILKPPKLKLCPQQPDFRVRATTNPKFPVP